MLKLSVLDQTPIPSGRTPSEALQHTVELAQLVEKLGYHRFWVSEHHDTESLAGSSPEILISHIAAKTDRIRVGSGGVMLPHYSSYKVAENFRLLEALYPNRIDLGLGRAPGGMPLATRALQEGKVRTIDRYPEQIDDLIGFLHDSLEPEHPYASLQVAPVIDTAPEIWLLGSSGGSAAIAAEKGAPFAFAQFINGNGGEHAAKQYKQYFRPSVVCSKPYTAVAIFVVCAETSDEAERIASGLDLTLLLIEQGIRVKGTPSKEEAQQYTYSPFEQQRVSENRKRMIVGNPNEVKEQLMDLAERYEADELILVSITHDFQDRLQSYQLIADAFNMKAF